MAVAVRQQIFSENYVENLMNFWGGFFYPEEWAVKSGLGSGFVNNDLSFKGRFSLKVTNSSSTNPVEIYSGTTDDLINLQSGDYFISFSVYNPNTENITGTLRIYDALTEIETFEFDLEDEKNKWVTFVQKLNVPSTTQLQFGYEINGTGSTGAVVHFDGLKVALDDRGSLLSDKYTFPANIIPTITSKTATLEFGTIGTHDYADLTVFVLNASSGDVVGLGTPALTSEHYFFTAFVSDVNEVTVRCINYGSGSVDVASGTFKISIVK